MKKILAILLTLVLVISFTACGKKETVDYAAKLSIEMTAEFEIFLDNELSVLKVNAMNDDAKSFENDLEFKEGDLKAVIKDIIAKGKAKDYLKTDASVSFAVIENNSESITDDDILTIANAAVAETVTDVGVNIQVENTNNQESSNSKESSSMSTPSASQPSQNTNQPSQNSSQPSQNGSQSSQNGSQPTVSDVNTNTNQPTHTHSFSAANCIEPKKCSCGATEGSPLYHSYSGGVCIRCGKENNMKISKFFASGMVFAAGKPIRIFGEGEGTAKITFDGVSKDVNSISDTWCVEFDPKQYGGPYELSFEVNGNKVTFSDIHVGEVYLLSGQSNMVFKLSYTNTNSSYYETNDKLRYINIASAPNEMSWTSAKKNEVGTWSALGYLVGREIVKDKNIHVGIILCAGDASAIESWMPSGALEKIGISIPLKDKYKDHADYYWNEDGYYYEKKLMRFAPFSLSGVVWYQGESDTSDAEAKVYERELTEFIRIWRDTFNDKNLPFCVVQLAGYRTDSAWTKVQEAQANISGKVANTYTVISKDICETNDIHPVSKLALAQRIAETIKNNF